MTTIVQFAQEANSSAVTLVRVGIFLGHKITNANESFGFIEAVKLVEIILHCWISSEQV